MKNVGMNLQIDQNWVLPQGVGSWLNCPGLNLFAHPKTRNTCIAIGALQLPTLGNRSETMKDWSQIEGRVSCKGWRQAVIFFACSKFPMSDKTLLRNDICTKTVCQGVPGKAVGRGIPSRGNSRCKDPKVGDESGVFKEPKEGQWSWSQWQGGKWWAQSEKSRQRPEQESAD